MYWIGEIVYLMGDFNKVEVWFENFYECFFDFLLGVYLWLYLGDVFFE